MTVYYIEGNNMEIIAEFQLGSEIRFKSIITDYDKITRIDPDSQTVKLYCEDSVVDSGTPIKISVGEWYYSYQSQSTDPLGTWYIEWSITKDAKTTIKREKFRVLHSGKK